MNNFTRETMLNCVIIVCNTLTLKCLRLFSLPIRCFDINTKDEM